MKNRKTRLLIILAIVAIAAVLLLVFLDQRDIFSGNRVKNPDAYILEFSYMNQTDAHELPLSEGDELSVDFSIDKGTVDLIIGMDGEEPIYRGNSIDSGNFRLEIPEAGGYRITVEARHAAGSISVNTVKSGSKCIQA